MQEAEGNSAGHLLVAAERYIAKVYRYILLTSETVDEAQQNLHDFARYHLTGQCNNGNGFCAKRQCSKKQTESNRPPLRLPFLNFHIHQGQHREKPVCPCIEKLA